MMPEVECIGDAGHDCVLLITQTETLLRERAALLVQAILKKDALATVIEMREPPERTSRTTL
jgi:hypothetical protein